MNETERNVGQIKVKPVTQDIIDEFYFLEATTPQNSITFSQLDLEISLYQSRLKKLISDGVLVQQSANSERFYLDTKKYQEWEIMQKKNFFLTLVSIIIPGVIIILLGIAWIILAV